MRKIAFGYSNKCNLKCGHCVAAAEVPQYEKMELSQAGKIIVDMAAAGVSGISFTAGEPFLFFDDLLNLLQLCRSENMYTRIVTNCFWAASLETAVQKITSLKLCGLSQLRISSSRWHQQHVPLQNLVNAAEACLSSGLEYFISFVTDFAEEDDIFEDFFRAGNLKFFPEPMIYAGRAEHLGRKKILTDYQENCCAMNPYLAPDLNLYACCDAGSHFNTTDVFLLGNLKEHTVEELYLKLEANPLFHSIRNQGISTIASYAGFKARDIVSYRKCELCKILFDDPEILAKLNQAAGDGLQRWRR